MRFRFGFVIFFKPCALLLHCMLAVKKQLLFYYFIITKCPSEVTQVLSGALCQKKKQWEAVKVKNENQVPSANLHVNASFFWYFK